MEWLYVIDKNCYKVIRLSSTKVDYYRSTVTGINSLATKVYLEDYYL